jgi:curli biogenesis system outer membrane secretion channel CsgG
MALLTSGCAAGGMVGAKVDPVTAAPEPAAGPRPTIAVTAFKIAAPKAKQVIGDGLSDMLSMALLRTQCCQVLEVDNDGSTDATYLVVGALTEFEPSAGGVNADLPAGTPLDKVRGRLAGIMQDLGIQSAKAEAAEVGIDIRLIEQRNSKIHNATHVRGYAVDLESLKFSDDSLGSGLEVYSNTPMEAAVRDAIEQAAVFVAQSAEPIY